MGPKRNQAVIPLIVTDSGPINESQTPLPVALFNPDGTPFEFSDGGTGTPEDLAEHIADSTPHTAAMSGLDLSMVYAAGRI